MLQHLSKSPSTRLLSHVVMLEMICMHIDHNWADNHPRGSNDLPSIVFSTFFVSAMVTAMSMSSGHDWRGWKAFYTYFNCVRTNEACIEPKQPAERLSCTGMHEELMNHFSLGESNF